MNHFERRRMRGNRSLGIVEGTIGVAALGALLLAASPAPVAQGPHLVKLPNGDYTIPMSELEASGIHGTATFHPSGPKTIVTIRTYGLRRRHQFVLQPGSSCSQLAGSNAVKLKPALTGEPSQTVVSLPITNLTSHNYVIAAGDATAQNQFKEACGAL